METTAHIKRVRIDLPTGKRRKAIANRGNLTEAKVADLAPKRKPYRVWDTGSQGVKGLHVLVSPAGTKLFRFSFRFRSAPSAIAYALGRWPGMTLEEAREKATAAAKLVRKGADPRVVDPANSDLFQDVVTVWYREEQRGLKRKSADENKGILLREFASLLNRPIADITYREVHTTLINIRDQRGHPGACRRAYTTVKSFFSWATREQLIPRSPIAEMRSPVPTPQHRVRAWFAKEPADRFAGDLWTYAATRKPHAGKLLKLLLCLGKRINIVASMRWEDIDDTWYWTPPKGSKNKLNNPVVLPKLAREVIGPHQGTGLVLGHTFTRGDFAILAVQVRRHVEPTFFNHGLRHLVATKLRELGVPFDVRRMVLDHTPTFDTHGGYEHHDYREEIAQALELWCKRIKAVVAAPKRIERVRITERVARVRL